MKIEDFSRLVQTYAATVLSEKATGWPAKFAIGAFVPRIPEKVHALASAAGALGPDGDVKVGQLHEMVQSGFKTAGHLSLLGGVIGFDPEDAEELFAYINNGH